MHSNYSKSTVPDVYKLMIKRFFSCLLFGFVLVNMALAQDYDIYTSDDIYLSNIKTVIFEVSGSPGSIPIVKLNSGSRLRLQFDDLDGDSKNYTYEIIHCDKNWNPSDLNEMDYLDGFNGEEIRDVDFSSSTIQTYSNYNLFLPNDNVQWTISGNYLLVVYEEEGDRIPAITRRFMVSEQVVNIDTELIRPRWVANLNTHHEFKFEIDTKFLPINRPLKEIEAVVMQNGRWDNAIYGLAPKFISGDVLKFDYTNKITFPALKEFRQFDIRTLDYTFEGVQAIDKHRYGTDVLLELDEKRLNANYYTLPDFNGGFRILLLDEYETPRLNAEYVNVIFTLRSPLEYFDGDVYIFGKLTDWMIHPDFKMDYDQEGFYRTELFLKQGVYDYMYALVKDDNMDLVELEGSWRETENEYSVLVYYSEFGTRYDRLIAVRSFNSYMGER